MREDFKTGIKGLCRLFGKTRHAYYDKAWREDTQTVEYAIILRLVKEQRELMPRIGTPKLHKLIEHSLEKHQIKIGIKKLHALLSFYGMTIRKKRRKATTTDSNHRFKKYPNLLLDIEIAYAEEVWVSDITYITLVTGFCYLSIVTDAYSHKIMGHCLYKTLERHGPLKALRNAVANRIYLEHTIIHHSDRGLQYACDEYIECLNNAGIKPSMTEKADPYENPIAERVNGILKDEFNLYRTFENFEEAEFEISKAIEIYNFCRPHLSCDYLTPDQAHRQTEPLQKRWKSYPYKKKFYEHS